jgi:hypothetical protein
MTPETRCLTFDLPAVARDSGLPQSAVAEDTGPTGAVSAHGPFDALLMKFGENTWAAVKGYLDEVTAVAAAPVIEKYTGVLAAADVFTESTTFWVMESIRLDLGYGSQVHP